MTIRHIVMWKLQGDESEKAATVSALSARLNNLMGVIPSALAISAGSNVVGGAGNWDMGLVADFASQTDLDAYQSHPLHQEIVRDIKAVAIERAAVDIEL